MMNTPEVSVDRITEAAWTRFRRRLADRLATLDIGDAVVVEVEDGDDDGDEGGCTPYVQASSDDGRTASAEVSSNRYLHRRHRLDKVSRGRLRELGWTRPSCSRDTLNYSNEFDLSHADEAAVMMVRALREVFGVVHPAFLVAPLLETDPGDLPAEVVPMASRPAEEPRLRTPEDKDELERLVDEALMPVFGHPPVRDEDGDIGVTSGSAVVFIRVLSDQPVVQLFAELAVGVTEHERARFEVGVLNRDWKRVKFMLVGDMVRADVFVPGSPFVPEHLRQALGTMCEMADKVDDDLAYRVGGRTFVQPSDFPAPGDD